MLLFLSPWYFSGLSSGSESVAFNWFKGCTLNYAGWCIIKKCITRVARVAVFRSNDAWPMLINADDVGQLGYQHGKPTGNTLTIFKFNAF